MPVTAGPSPSSRLSSAGETRVKPSKSMLRIRSFAARVHFVDDPDLVRLRSIEDFGPWRRRNRGFRSSARIRASDLLDRPVLEDALLPDRPDRACRPSAPSLDDDPLLGDDREIQRDGVVGLVEDPSPDGTSARGYPSSLPGGLQAGHSRPPATCGIVRLPRPASRCGRRRSRDRRSARPFESRPRGSRNARPGRSRRTSMAGWA